MTSWNKATSLSSHSYYVLDAAATNSLPLRMKQGQGKTIDIAPAAEVAASSVASAAAEFLFWVLRRRQGRLRRDSCAWQLGT